MTSSFPIQDPEATVGPVEQGCWWQRKVWYRSKLSGHLPQFLFFLLINCPRLIMGRIWILRMMRPNCILQQEISQKFPNKLNQTSWSHQLPTKVFNHPTLAPLAIEAFPTLAHLEDYQWKLEILTTGLRQLALVLPEVQLEDSKIKIQGFLCYWSDLHQFW